MQWIPPFGKLLFLLAVGFVLTIIGAAITVQQPSSNLSVYIRILGLILIVLNLILISLKFLAQANRKPK